MRYPSLVEVAKIEHSIRREGFSEPYHEVTFRLTSEGIPFNERSVRVHPAFPAADFVHIARTYLWSRLPALTEAAEQHRFSETEIYALGTAVKSENFAAN